MRDCIGVDIGGSLIKFVSNQESHIYSIDLIEEFLDFLHLFSQKQECFPQICFTGGGAVKYRKLIANKLGQDFRTVDEMECIVKGMSSYLSHQLTYPFLIVNIGSGISVLSVKSPQVYHRITGTALAGSTLRGLVFLITGIQNFSEIIAMANSGITSKVDLQVKDIYGTDYEAGRLSGETVAGCLGKILPPGTSTYSQEDVVASILQMVCEHIGLISSSCAKIERTHRIYFTGGLVEAEIVRNKIEWAISQIDEELDIVFRPDSVFVGAFGAKQTAMSLSC